MANLPLLRVKRPVGHDVPDELHVRVRKRQRVVLSDQLNALSLTTTATGNGQTQPHGAFSHCSSCCATANSTAGSAGTRTEQIGNVEDDESTYVVFRRVKAARLGTLMTGENPVDNGAVKPNEYQALEARGGLREDSLNRLGAQGREGEGAKGVIVDVDSRHLKRSLHQLDEKQATSGYTSTTPTTVDSASTAPVTASPDLQKNSSTNNRGSQNDIDEHNDFVMFAPTDKREWQKTKSVSEQHSATALHPESEIRHATAVGDGRGANGQQQGEAVIYMDAESIEELHELLGAAIIADDSSDDENRHLRDDDSDFDARTVDYPSTPEESGSDSDEGGEGDYGYRRRDYGDDNDEYDDHEQYEDYNDDYDDYLDGGSYEDYDED